MIYFAPEAEMVDVLTIGGPKLWVDCPKQVSLSPSYISTSAHFYGDLESFEKQASISPSDCYSFDSPQTVASHTFLHCPTPRSQTPAQLQRFSENMMSFKGSTKQETSASGENILDMPLKIESQHPAVYCQSMPSFMPQPDFKVALSSNGSTYCDSDLESLEPYDDSFGHSLEGGHCCLVHPIPKTSPYAAGNNISFLSSNDEASSLPSIESQDTPLEDSFFSSHPTRVSNNSHFKMSGPSDHTHHIQPVTPLGLMEAKNSPYDDTLAWSAWNSTTPSYAWYPSNIIGDASYEGSWHSPVHQNVSWAESGHLHRPEDIYDHSAQHTGPSTELSMMLPSQPSHSGTSPSPVISQSCTPNSTLQAGARESYSRNFFPMPQTYLPSHHTDYSDADAVSPLQKSAGSLSPSSFTRSSPTEGGPSPRQSGDEQTGVEANMHYSDERNAFLIDCKRRGLSYKDIKRVGGFKEAESTLRGRYRTLTKTKDQRVRKPKWQSKDVCASFWTVIFSLLRDHQTNISFNRQVRLLCEAVSIYAETPDTYSSLTHLGMTMNEPPKVSWKKVAEHIWAQGGSYQFGNATCKKKWCEIHNIRI